MKVNRLIFALLIVLLSIVSGGSRLRLESQMQEILDKGIRKYNIHGVSAAVIFPDETLWTGTSGVSHDTVSIKPDMLFAVGSVTKNCVAALALQLAEENVLSLKDPLSKWLPDYDYVDNSITIRQLLNHTSGLYMFWENQQIWDDLKKYRAKEFSPEEVLSYIKQPHFEAGEGWRYSNTNYLLMAMIIEKATGSTLAVEFRNRFWQPLGIDSTFLSQQDGIPYNQVHVYGDNFIFGESEQDLTFLPRTSHESIGFGSSGIFMSAENLARWSDALFNEKIISRQSLDEMMEFIDIKPISNMWGYGLGLQIYTRSFSSGKMAVGHGGGNIGSTTYMVYLPDSDISLVVMINAFPNRGADYITKRLIRKVLKDQNQMGLVPYIPLIPFGLFLISLCLFITLNLVFYIKKINASRV